MFNGNAPLAGIKVLDFTQFEAGPTCTEAMAWHGAEVVKVENPNGGDPGRLAGSEDGKTDAYYFLELNANKKSITADLKNPKGIELIKKMAAKSDVFIENLAPGTIERLGLGYEDIKAINPGIVYVQIKGFAKGSPYESFLSFDMIGQATGGTMSTTGEPDGKPLKPGPTLADTGTGMLACISILSALYKRKDTGEGAHLQLAMQDAMIQYSRIAYSTMATTGKAAQRTGVSLGAANNAPNGLFPCKPGGSNDWIYVYVTRANNRHWDRMLKVIGREDLIGNEDYSTPVKRGERKEEIEEMLSAWTRQYTKEEAMELLGSAGVPAGAVYDTMELHSDESMTERGIFQTIDHPTRGKFKMPGWPVKSSNGNIAVEPSPLLGEHTEPVLKDWLELSDVEVAALKEEGIVK